MFNFKCQGDNNVQIVFGTKRIKIKTFQLIINYTMKYLCTEVKTACLVNLTTEIFSNYFNFDLSYFKVVDIMVHYLFFNKNLPNFKMKKILSDSQY